MTDYKTINNEASAQLIEKRSKFIGYVSPVLSEEEALDFICKIKALHWDAKHNVYAYDVIKDGRQRYSDDSEPKGTAGLPIMEIIKKEGLKNIVIVVTRYFGGVLLGKGGLIRAYSGVAKMAIDEAQIVNMSLCKLYNLAIDYNFYAKVSSLITSNFGFIDNTDFTDKVKLTFHIKDIYIDRLMIKINDATAGSFDIKFIKEIFLKTT